MQSPWTPEIEDELRRRWAAGQTAREIADVLPAMPGEGELPPRRITRDMVIGKARRMGLPSRPSPIKQKRTA